MKTQRTLGTTTTTSTIAAKRRSTTIENGENSFKGKALICTYQVLTTRVVTVMEILSVSGKIKQLFVSQSTFSNELLIPCNTFLCQAIKKKSAVHLTSNPQNLGTRSYGI